MMNIAERVKEYIKRIIILLFPSVVASYIHKNPHIYNSLRIWGGDLLSDMTEEYINIYLTKEEIIDTSLISTIKKDILICHFKYGISPIEYFVHDFRYKKETLRGTYMSKMLKDKLIMSQLGSLREQAFVELKDKSQFYNLAKEYFKRDVCSINGLNDYKNFKSFTKTHSRFIAKPINGRFGKNTNIYDLKDYNNSSKVVFDILMNIADDWIVEELIVQDARFSEWNPSSVNTIRIPSFRTANGIFVFAPFMRTGRKGSPVDNGGAGGIMVSIDSNNGVICTNAIDELGHSFILHPDSNKEFKGWIVPNWDQLLALSAEVHNSLPEYHKYIGFDFALSQDKGWVLVEGNWGDFICQQATLGRGLKKEFKQLINS